MKRPTPKANSPVPPPLHPSPMAIVGAILAQGAIRLIDRQNREEAAAKKRWTPRTRTRPPARITTPSDSQLATDTTRAVQIYVIRNNQPYRRVHG